MDSRLTGLDLKTSLSAIEDLVLPRVCVACGRVLIPQERHICLNCLADLPETHFAAFSHNPMADRFNARTAGDEYEPYAYAAALFHYNADSKYSRITQALKYHRDFGSGRFFARMLGSRLAASELFKGVDLVVPVPLHWTRQWTRGYNQAEVIARELAKALSAPCRTDILRRGRRTATQTRLTGEEKVANVAGAFQAVAHRPDRKTASAESGSGVGHILLVDDVFTSGATLAECHKALRKVFGPTVRISAATLAYAGE